MSELHIDDLLHKRLVFCDVEATDQQDLLTRLCGEAHAQGFIKNSYLEAVLERERTYPTGLPTNIMKVAVPHTMDKSHVLRSAIVIARLKKPVAFKEMGNGERDVPVEMVFMLAVNGTHEQLNILQNVVGLFSREDVMAELKDALTPDAIIDCVRKHVAA